MTRRIVSRGVAVAIVDRIDRYATDHTREPRYVVLDGSVVLRPIMEGPFGESIQLLGVEDVTTDRR